MKWFDKVIVKISCRYYTSRQGFWAVFATVINPILFLQKVEGPHASNNFTSQRTIYKNW